MGKLWSSAKEGDVIVKSNGTKLQLHKGKRYLANDDKGQWLTFELVGLEFSEKRGKYVLRLTKMFTSSGNIRYENGRIALFSFDLKDGGDLYDSIVPTEIDSLLETMLYNTDKLKQHGSR